MNGKWSILGALACGGAALWSTQARADAELDKCGGMFLSVDAHCEYRPKKECMTECKTSAVETSCVAKVYHECENHCTATATTTCQSSCTETCSTECTKDESVNCQGLCESECQNDCDSRCSDGGDHCGGCCSHNCSAKCEGQCQGHEETKCDERCMTACSGSCTAEATIDCQLECQDKTYVSCEKEMVTTCETSCEDKGGAIFCDGQFINASSIKDCAAELASKIDIHIDISAVTDICSGDKCDGDTVKKETKETLSCSARPASKHGQEGPLALLTLGAGAFWFVRRRKQR